MTGSVAKPPISVHPAFPAVVALWFAALLGLGSLVVPVTLVEQMATASGLASAIPAAAPPLGFTARCLIALAFTVVGAVAGLLIARQVARAHGAPARESGRKPISAHAELGREGLGNAASRRRALAMAEEGRSDFFDQAPLPGAREFEDFSDELADEHAEAERQDDDIEPAPAAEPARPKLLDLHALELGDFEEQGDEVGYDAEPAFEAEPDIHSESYFHSRRVEPQQFAAPIAAQNADEHTDEHTEDDFMSDRQDFITPGKPEDFARPEPAVHDDSLPARSDRSISFSRPEDATPDRQEETAAPVEEDRGEECEDLFAPDADGGELDGVGSSVMPPRASHWEESPLDDLGLVQLAQRLGTSIEKHREFRSARAEALASAATPAPSPVPGDFDIAAPEDAAQAMAAYFGKADRGQAAGAGSDEDLPSARAPSGPAETEPAYDEPVAQFAVADEEDDEIVEQRQVFRPIEDNTDKSAYRPFSGFSKLPDGDEDEGEDDEGALDDLSASFSLPLARRQQATAVKAPDPAAAATQEDPEGPVEAPRQLFKPGAPVDQAEGEFAEDDQRRSGDGDFVSADFAEDEMEEYEAAEQTAGFGSLLGMRNPFKERAAEFVRIEDEPRDESGIVEPTVVFPAEEESRPAAAPRAFDKPAARSDVDPSRKLDPEENERALREALLNLQRMSGAA